MIDQCDAICPNQINVQRCEMPAEHECFHSANGGAVFWGFNERCECCHNDCDPNDCPGCLNDPVLVNAR